MANNFCPFINGGCNKDSCMLFNDFGMDGEECVFKTISNTLQSLARSVDLLEIPKETKPKTKVKPS